jgi:hypothetical protein
MKDRSETRSEDRIHNEAIVHASPEEQAMGWYYYLQDKISFPFRARCLAANAVSPLRNAIPTTPNTIRIQNRLIGTIIDLRSISRSRSSLAGATGRTAPAVGTGVHRWLMI